MPSVILSGFADEAATEKTVDQQFSTMAALGLQHLSMRFIDVGNGVKNVLQLDTGEFDSLRSSLQNYGLHVASIGSPVGKVKIADQDDGTENRFVPFAEYLETEVTAAIEAANRLSTKLIRGFSFYHPRGSDHSQYLKQAIDQVGQITERCAAAGLVFGLEVEANLIGHRGEILKEIHQAINHESLVLIFDGGNLVTQGFDESEIMDQFQAMLPGLGWMHVKDYVAETSSKPGQYVDEEALNRFVPADRGGTNHLAIFRELKSHLPKILERLTKVGVDGFVLDLEPHLKGGGQFGGFSGPDGMGVALRALCSVLENSQIDFHLRDFSSLPRTH